MKHKDAVKRFGHLTNKSQEFSFSLMKANLRSTAATKLAVHIDCDQVLQKWFKQSKPRRSDQESPAHQEVLLASRRSHFDAAQQTSYDLASGLRCNIWWRSTTPGRITYEMVGGASSGSHWRGTVTGYASLRIQDFVDPGTNHHRYLLLHPVLKFLAYKISHFLCDFHRKWFPGMNLPKSDGRHKQLRAEHFQALLDTTKAIPGTKECEISVFSAVKLGHDNFSGHQIVHCKPFNTKQSRMDYVYFIPPPQFYNGNRSNFQPTLESCWYGQVVFIFRMHIATETSGTVECDCALIDVLFDFDCQSRLWWGDVADHGTKMVYQCSPEPVTYVIPVNNILGSLALVPAGDHGTIPRSAAHQQASHYPHGRCDSAGNVGSGSKLYFINMWALQWPSDHPVQG